MDSLAHLLIRSQRRRVYRGQSQPLSAPIQDNHISIPSSSTCASFLRPLPLTLTLTSWANFVQLTALGSFLHLTRSLHALCNVVAALITLLLVSKIALQSCAILNKVHLCRIVRRNLACRWAHCITAAALPLLVAPSSREQRKASAAMVKSRSKIRPLSFCLNIDAAYTQLGDRS